MFGKPKGWNEVSPEVQQQWDALTSKKRYDKLEEAIGKNQADLAAFILKQEKLSDYDRYRAAQKAIQMQAPESFLALFNGVKDYYCLEIEKERRYTGRDALTALAVLALTAGDVPTWDAVCQALCPLESSFCFYSTTEINKLIATKPMPELFTEPYLRMIKGGGDASLFGSMLSDVGFLSMPVFKSALSHTKKFGEPRHTLGNALTKAIGSQDVERTTLLIQNGADPNDLPCNIIDRALSTNNKALTEVLLPHIRLQNYIAATKNAHLNDLLSPVDKNTLQEMQVLPSGMKITTVFNFEAQQQILIVEKPDAGISVTRTDFADIDNQDYLEDKRQELIRLGGEPKDPRRISKPAPPTRKA